MQIDMSASLVGTKNAYLDEHGKVIEFVLTENDIIKEQLMHKTEDPEVLFYKLLGKDIHSFGSDAIETPCDSFGSFIIIVVRSS